MILPPQLLRAGILLGLGILMGCGKDPATPRGVPADPLIEKLANRRVAWIAPHADDEVSLAPLLGEACVYRGARCTLLLATDGRAWCPYGPCDSGLDPAVIRIAEHRAAAGILNARAVHLQPLLPNTSDPEGLTSAVLRAWQGAVGDANRIADLFVRALRDIQPDVVIIHDPRHGSSCHPEHLLTPQLVLMALSRSGSAPEVLFSEIGTRTEDTLDRGILGPAPFLQEPGLLTYDANRVMPSGETAWNFAVRLTAAYPSQYPPDRVASIARISPGLRRVYIIPAAAVNDRSASFCGNSDKRAAQASQPGA